jgi:hypothetical protein
MKIPSHLPWRAVPGSVASRVPRGEAISYNVDGSNEAGDCFVVTLKASLLAMTNNLIYNP